MSTALDRVADAIDIETFLVCRSEDEARQLAEALAGELNLPQSSIVFLEYNTWGARVRLRSYIHRPGGPYRWLQKAEQP